MRYGARGGEGPRSSLELPARRSRRRDGIPLGSDGHYRTQASRRIAAGWQKPDECRYITKTNLGRIYELLEEGVEVGPESIPVGHIIEIQPCAQYGKVTLEAQLSRPSESIFDVFDSCELCTSLGDVGLLKNVRCSLEMGYSIAEHNETRIHIFKTGKIASCEKSPLCITMISSDTIF